MRAVVVILGPTASGKSDLALALAQKLNGEIVNADSRQIYRRLDAGTAKPDAAERRAVPHHLLDIVEPLQSFSAAEFLRCADESIEAITSRGRLPLLVGGTGLYVRALLQGLFEGPTRSREIHERLERVADRRGLDSLWRWLQRVDPQWAGAVARSDRQRILRGLDVYLQTGVPISRQIARSQRGERYNSLKIGILWEKEELHQRIDVRAERMFVQGLEQEVRELMKLEGFEGSNAARSVGYREVIAALKGELSRAELIPRVQRATRQLAKRQMTWFRREPNVYWLRPRNGELPTMEAEDLTLQWLEGKCLHEPAELS